MVSVSISHSDFIFILRDFFLHKYIYIGLHIEYPTLHFSPYTSYAPVVASPHSRAIKDPLLKLLGLAFSPHSTFPPSLSYTEVVSTTATKRYRTGNQYVSFGKILGVKHGSQPWGARDAAGAAPQ